MPHAPSKCCDQWHDHHLLGGCPRCPVPANLGNLQIEKLQIIYNLAKVSAKCSAKQWKPWVPLGNSRRPQCESSEQADKKAQWVGFALRRFPFGGAENFHLFPTAIHPLGHPFGQATHTFHMSKPPVIRAAETSDDKTHFK